MSLNSMGLHPYNRAKSAVCREHLESMKFSKPIYEASGVWLPQWQSWNCRASQSLREFVELLVLKIHTRGTESGPQGLLPEPATQVNLIYTKVQDPLGLNSKSTRGLLVLAWILQLTSSSFPREREFRAMQETGLYHMRLACESLRNEARTLISLSPRPDCIRVPAKRRRRLKT